MPALDPNAQIRPDEIIDDPELFPDQLPQGVSKSAGYYVIKKQLADGRIAYEWYKRGPKLPEGQAPQDPVVARSQGYAKAVADEYGKGQKEQSSEAQRTIQRAGHTWQWNPATNGYDIDLGPTDAQSKGPPGGKPYLDEEGPTGRRMGWNPDTQQYDRDLGSSPSAQATGAGSGTVREPVKDHPGVYAVKTVTKQPDGSSATETHYEDEGGRTVPEPTAAPTPVASTLNTSSPQVGMVLPDGTIRWTPNPNYQKPNPQALPLPPGQKWVAFQDPDGTIRTEKNPNFRPPSKIERDPGTGRLIEITEDDDGRPLIRPVTDQTTVKPADVPVLQATYGRIGQSLGTLLADLNGRVSRGEMTPQERDAAFKAAHQQASVQVEEINAILDNSKAVWTSRVEERGQTFTEAANRRSFAGSVMGNAMSTGREIAGGALPGSGRAIAEGVMTLMDMGQRYAAGMGGFPSMEPTRLPPALQQAAGMSLPGFGPEGGGGPPPPGAPPPPGPAAAPPSGADVAAANAATQAQSGAAFGGLGIPPPPVPGSMPAAPPLGTAPAAGGPAPGPLPYAGQDPNPTPLGPADVYRPGPPGGPVSPPLGEPDPYSPGPPGTDQVRLERQGLGVGSPLGALGSLFGAGMAGSPMGVPASAGGGGLFDPNGEAQAMLAASTSAGSYGGLGGADSEWERAVRAAMGMFG